MDRLDLWNGMECDGFVLLLIHSFGEIAFSAMDLLLCMDDGIEKRCFKPGVGCFALDD
jgi:hypothetical protein